MLIFDVETNGLLNELDRIHILALKNTETGEVKRYRNRSHGWKDAPQGDNDIEIGLRYMMECAARGETFAGHNVIKFDILAIKKVYPWFHIPEEQVLDTIVLARLIYPDLREIDAKLVAKKGYPKQLQKRYSLEAWGHRLGNHKGDFKGPWDVWTPEMEDYCAQDLEVTHALLNKLRSVKAYWEPQPVEAIFLEHQVAWIVARQERYGFYFDRDEAVKLYSKLTARKLELEAELRKVFPPFYLRDGHDLIPKRDNKKSGYVAGSALTKIKLTEFNPGSRDHVTLVLKRRYAWEPVEFTGDGKAKVDETVLAALPYPEAKLLTDYFTVLKRIGQLATGNEAWLKHVTQQGRIHGGVVTNGAVTGRMTHSHPNIGQTPTNKAPYGKECRELFKVTPIAAAVKKALCGADADALELRCLAAFMAKYDGGDYIRVVLEGRKENGTDMHSVNARALGLDPTGHPFGDKETGRDVAKTWFYAFIYGAGDEKLGLILTRKKGAAAKARGKKSKAQFMRNLPALGKFIKAVHDAVDKRGYLRGLDGRILKVRSKHSAPNTLLQSAGAVLMKRALVILDRELQALGYTNSGYDGFNPKVNYEFVANVHDEWQLELDENIGEIVGKTATEAIRKAGVHFNFRCPLAGAHGVGASWAATH